MAHSLGRDATDSGCRHLQMTGLSMCAQCHLVLHINHRMTQMMTLTVWCAWTMSRILYLCHVGTACAAQLAQRWFCRRTAHAQSAVLTLTATVAQRLNRLDAILICSRTSQLYTSHNPAHHSVVTYVSTQAAV